MDVVYLKYVGTQPRKRDRIAHTGTVWERHGDVKPVPSISAGKFLAHPDVWERVSAPADAPESPAGDWLGETASEVDPGFNAVMEAIYLLREGDPEHFTAGKPRASKLTEVLGYKVSGELRDRVWGYILEQREAVAKMEQGLGAGDAE